MSFNFTDTQIQKMREEDNHIDMLWNLTHQEEICTSMPHQAWIEVTNICNLKCEFCIQDKMKRPKGIMKFQTFKKIIDEIKDYTKYIDFCRQGEPLINKELPEMIKYAVDSGITGTRLITNGTLMTKELAQQIIDSGLRRINFSFSGTTKEEYERYQKNGNFSRTINNILDFLEIKYDKGVKSPLVEISMVVYDKLQNEIEEYKKKFSKMPFNKIKINQMIDFQGSNDDPELLMNLKKPLEEWPVCKTPYRFLGINWNGDLVPCLWDYDNKYNAGNVNEHSIKELWNGERMRFFRRCIIDKNFDKIETNGVLCSKCNQLWKNPRENGPQFPADFYEALEEYLKSRETQTGSNDRDIIVSEEDLEEKYVYLKNHRHKWLALFL